MQAKQGKISTILVKDLSRFSRNYLETGNYLNRIFPFLGVRFISVNDHYDSRKNKGSTLAADTVFQTLLYDFYTKDISSKVKTSLKNKCENGEWVFGQLPLGYKKNWEKGGEIIIDEREAQIVRYIFSLAESKMSCTQIAKKLHQENIPTVRKIRGLTDRDTSKIQTWSDSAVRKILKNRFYLGEMAYGKSTCQSPRSKKRISLPEHEWKIIPNHHIALISEDVFSRASLQNIPQKKPQKQKKNAHPLTGKIYCGGCGYSMSYKCQKGAENYRHFWCRKHALLKIPDCCAYFPASELEEAVLTQIAGEAKRRALKRNEVQMDGVQSDKTWEEFQKTEQKTLDSIQKKYHIQLRRLQEEKNELYENYAANAISAQKYRLLADKLTEKSERISRELTSAQEKSARLKERAANTLLSFDKLTQEMADLWIKRLTVRCGKRVEIEWNFPDPSCFHINLPSSGWGALDVQRLLAENLSDRNCQFPPDML